MKPKPQLSKPVLELKTIKGNIHKIYVYEAGQYCRISESKVFGGDNRAGMVYVEDHPNPNSEYAQDMHIDDAITWRWIQGWMEKGFKSEGL